MSLLKDIIGKQGRIVFRVITSATFITLSLVLISSSVTAPIWNIFGSEPMLTEEQQSWVLFEFDPAQSWERNPYEAPDDGYKMIRDYRTSERKTFERTIPASDAVEWGCKMVVRNKSDKIHDISISYKLLEKDGFVVSESNYIQQYIQPEETVTIQKTCVMDYDELPRVAQRAWTVGRSLNFALSHSD